MDAEDRGRTAYVVWLSVDIAIASITRGCSCRGAKSTAVIARVQLSFEFKIDALEIRHQMPRVVSSLRVARDSDRQLQVQAKLPTSTTISINNILLKVCKGKLWVLV